MLLLYIVHLENVTEISSVIIMLTAASTGEPRQTAFLFQRLSVAVQRFNAVVIQETFELSDGQPDL